VTVRVLVVVPDGSATGVPIGALRTVRGLVAGATVAPVVLFLRDGPLVADVGRLAPTGVLAPGDGRGAADLVELGLGELGAAAVARRSFARRVRRSIRRLGSVEVVYLAGAAAFAARPGLPDGVPVVGHVHELPEGLRRALPPELRHELADVDRLLATNAPVVRGLGEAGLATEDVACIGELVPDELPPPVETAGALRRRTGIPERARVVGAMGSLIPRKGPDLFVQLGMYLAATGADAHLVWVGGGGHELVQLRRDVHAAGLDGRLHLVGAQADPYDWHRLFDVLVVPSREDTQPLAALEAMQVGTPVVAFAQGGLPGLLGDDERGVLVPPLDTSALAAAVRAALEGHQDTTDRSRRAQAYVWARHRASVVVPVVQEALVALAGTTAARRRQ
jgi:glycosyltransferase involved in cell wall biosynthesis